MTKSKIETAKDKLAQAQTMPDVRTAMEGLSAEERNQLTFEAFKATERIVGQK